MRINVEGRQLVARNLDTARPRDIAELQRQTGWGLKQIRDEIQGADILGAILVIFLTLAANGYEPNWDQLLDGEGPVKLTDLKQDPLDDKLAAEDGETQDPHEPSLSDSDPAAAPPAVEGA